MTEIVAYHEAGHAVAACILGGEVKWVTIAPADDDGPQRYGDTRIEWATGTERQRRLNSIQVALAGPVVEMIYTQDRFHPALVAEWAADWQLAWEAMAPLVSDEARRMRNLETMTRQLYEQFNDELLWATVAEVADLLLAHETLEMDEVLECVQRWHE